MSIGEKISDSNAMFKLSYGLFLLTAKDEKDNGCIINTAMQITSNPNKIMISVSKENYTHDMIMKTGLFNVSVLTTETTFEIFKHFGFQSGKDADKFNFTAVKRSENGIYYLTIFSNAFISAKVTQTLDCGTHTIFIADVTESKVLSDKESMTYKYYFDNVKPKPKNEKKKGYVCNICGYVYEGEELPDDFICPICKHGAGDFSPLF